MTTKQRDQFNRMLATLKRIASDYMTPAQHRKGAEKCFGLSPAESMEYAYENIQQEAKLATRGVKEIATIVKPNTELTSGI